MSLRVKIPFILAVAAIGMLMALTVSLAPISDAWRFAFAKFLWNTAPYVMFAVLAWVERSGAAVVLGGLFVLLPDLYLNLDRARIAASAAGETLLWAAPAILAFVFLPIGIWLGRKIAPPRGRLYYPENAG